MEYPPVAGQPSIPGRYWVYPNGYFTPIMARIEYISQGPQTLAPELHCFDYSPAAGDVWFGPLPFPAVPDWGNSLSQTPESKS